MSKPTPWWISHPRELWTPADYANARKAGVKLPDDPAGLYQPLNETLPVQPTHPAPSFTLNPSKRQQATDALRKAGIRK